MVNLGNCEDGGRRMYLRRPEMGAATAGLRRWLVLAALSSNTMRREQRCWFRRQQRLQHETGAEVASPVAAKAAARTPRTPVLSTMCPDWFLP